MTRRMRTFILHGSVLLGLAMVGVKAHPQDGKKVSWDCYGDIAPATTEQLLHMRGITGPGADTIEVRSRLNQKHVLLTLTATAPAAQDSSAVTRFYNDPSGQRWSYRYANGIASLLMIDTNNGLLCTPA